MPRQTPSNLVTMLDALRDGVYIIGADYTVTFMNRTMVKLFGEGAGQKCYEVINRSAVRCPWCRADELFDHGEVQHAEIYLPVVDRHFQVTNLPIRNQDGSLSMLSIYRDITDNRDQARRLRATEEDYRRLFEHAGAGVYISSKEGKFLDANAALLEMLGYRDKAELLRMNLQRDLYVRPEDRFKFQQLIERDGRVIDYEVDFKRKDGSTLPVLLTSHVRYDARGQVLGYEGICVDQSQRRKMERQLREAHDFLNNVIQSSPNAIMGTNMAGDLIIWNKGAEETLGYRAEEVIGKMNVRQLYPEGVAREVMRMMRMDRYGGRGKLRAFPMNFRRKDGAIVEGSLSASIIHDESGAEIASVGIFVDLGERLEMERKLRQTQEQLLQSEKLAAMGRLTSQIAHELNNPLYGIMNTLELMKTEISPTNKRRKLLDMSLSETMRLADMLRKMLSFSKPDQEEKCPVAVNEILDEILMLHEKQLREHDIKLVAVPAPELPTEMVGQNGRVTALTCIRMRLGNPDESGRRRPEAIPDSTFTLPVDSVIMAIGQESDWACLTEECACTLSDWGTLRVDPLTLQSEDPDIFAGGDAVSGPRTVVEAIAAGKEAAVSIHRFLRGEDLRAGRDRPSAVAAVEPPSVPRRNRAIMARRAPEVRSGDFEEVHLGLTADQLAKEAARCLGCGGCCECYRCVEACLARAVHHDMGPAEHHLEVGAVILAPGIAPFDPSVYITYGYGAHPDVVTSLEFERLLSASGPNAGHLVRPSDGRPPAKIAWLQCVGSRDENACDRGYCSSVCCMYANKQAVIAKEHSEKPLDAAVFYMDMRTFGKDFDRYHQRAESEYGVRFIRSRIHSVLPAENGRLCIVKAALVVGGGVAGMEAALGLADQGCRVYLVERAAGLGGVARNLRHAWQGDPVAPYLKGLIERTVSHPSVEVFTETVVTGTGGSVGHFTTRLASINGRANAATVVHGVTILATGGRELAPADHLYGQHPDVLTHLDLEAAFEAGDPRLARAGSVLFIQCVGSRTPERPYCSKVCCTHSLRAALALHEKNPKARIYIAYRDIRAFGRRETLYRQARQKGVIFIRYDLGRPPKVRTGEDRRLKVELQDHVLRSQIRLRPDLVVIASAIVPNDNQTLFEMFKVPVNADGFLIEAHAKLRPVDLAADGIFMAGLAHWPKPLEETIAQARAACARAMTLLSHERIMVGGIVATVDPGRCALCLTCVRTCPYGVPRVGAHAHAEIEPALCHGCGTCAAECPGKAIELQHYTDAQLIAKTAALFAEAAA